MKNKKGSGEIIGIFGLAFVVFAMIMSFVFTKISDEKVITEKRPIYSIRESNDLKGEFILGTGYIKEKPYYIFREIISENPIRLKTANIEQSKYDLVLKDDIEQAYIEEQYKTYTATSLFIFKSEEKKLIDSYIVVPSNYIEEKVDIK